jgi:tetratricopeptide (TPR) repeat protein
LNAATKSLAELCLVDTTDAGERLIIEGLTRELAKARLSKDERAIEFRRRFVAYFLGFAELHAETKPEDFDALEAERDNVLSAMDVASEINDRHSVMRMMDAIGNATEGFLILRGYWDEFIQRGEQALFASQKAEDEWHIGAFANGLGVIFTNRGNYSLAKKHFEVAVKIARKIDAQQGLAATLHELGRLAQKQGELEEARRFYNESMEINKKLGDQSGIASALHQLGMITHDQGELDEARRLYNESVEITNQLGDQSMLARTLHNLGRLAQGQGEIDEARRLYNESLEIKKKLSNQEGIAITLGQLGRLVENEGDLAEAARLFREALSIFEKLGSTYVELARKDLKRVEGEE